MPSVPEAAVVVAGTIARIYEPRATDDNPRRRALVNAQDGSVVLGFTPEQEAELPAGELVVGKDVVWLIRYGLYVNDQKVPYLTRRFVGVFDEADALYLEAQIKAAGSPAVVG